MNELYSRVHTNNNNYGVSLAQTYSLKSAVNKFGDRAREAALGEMRQLHDRVVFEPVNVDSLLPKERKRAMESLMFLTEKRDGTIKGRTCANGSIQREYIDREDAASPTAMTESILIAATIDAKQRRDVMTADIPNAFVQTEIDDKDFGHRVIMKIRGALVDILLEIDSEIYKPYV